MMVLYKPNIEFLSAHAIDPDKRRYAILEEGPRHYIDIDQYGQYPYPNLPHAWEEAVEKFSEDSLKRYGIDKARIYVQGANLYTLTNYSGLDPEIPGSSTSFGVDWGNYPPSRTFNVGVSLTF